MKNLRYITDTATLTLDIDTCIGCGNCHVVCPHRVFEMVDKKAAIQDLDGCMECGACAQNCPVAAIHVTPGVGCAVEIISWWLNKTLGRKIMKGCC